MNIEPETYEELIRMKRCVILTKYYELSEEEVNKIYQFLTENKDGVIRGGTQNLSLSLVQNETVLDVISARCISSQIDGIVLSNKLLNIIPHYTPSSSGSYSGGSSSNNNNNNNNNNNR